MAKRTIIDDSHDNALKKGDRPAQNGQESDGSSSDRNFEDEFEDEFESEDEILEAGVDGGPDAEREAGEKDTMDIDQQTFIPGRHKLQAGQSLSPDVSAYEMLHTLSTTWPCLSFDILRDNLGDKRKTYPATLYVAAGTQAEAGRARENELLVMKLSGLGRAEKGGGEEDSDSDDLEDSDDESSEPILETKSIPLHSTTNRIRTHQTPPSDSLSPPRTLTATMTEDAELLIHDITPHLTSFNTPGTTITPQQSKPLATLKMHRAEGYAVAWSPLVPQGKLLTGDNDGKIFASSCSDGGKWVGDTRPFTGHAGSVEDVQWSPNERSVFASASSDGTVKVWDIRSKSRKPAVDVRASEVDVNVLSWSHQTVHLLATGADDGEWAVWDLRQWKPQASDASARGGSGAAPRLSNQIRPSAVASFRFHKEQITSVEWHPTDDSIVAVAAGDNTLTLWDLAVELDDEESRDTAGVRDVPPQLLFVHYIEAVKECHWHPQIPGCVMGTGSSGFGVFKSISV